MEKQFNPISVSQLNLPVKNPSGRVRQPFNDSRRYAVFESMVSQSTAKGSVVVCQLADNRAQAARYYNFLGNEDVKLQEVIKMCCISRHEAISGKHVLVLGDTTTYNLNKHRRRIQDVENLGVLDDNKSMGFYCHVNLALDANSGDVLGLADILFWSRPKSPPKAAKEPKAVAEGAAAKAKEGKPPVAAVPEVTWEQKESYKWFLGMQNSCNALEQAALRTFVTDRESDIYELLYGMDGFQRCHAVVRSKVDRKVLWNGKVLTMSQVLGQVPLAGTYQLELPELDHYSSTHGQRIRRKKRTATIEVRFAAVEILPPAGLDRPALARWIVEAREVGFVPQPGENQEPIHWRLITTHSVETFEGAKCIIQFYTKRWGAEQLFRTTKKEGFKLEETELETVDAIQRQTAIGLKSATTVLQLVAARDRTDSQPIEEVFDQQERETLDILNQKYQGTTEVQQNPFPSTQTSWATWIIARLGGWKGYASQGPPGPICIKQGLQRFHYYVDAFMLWPAPS